MNKNERKKPKFLLTIVLCIVISYLSLPILNHGFRAFFQCRTKCSASKIINTPWLFHGRKVTIIGFLRIQFEANALYPSEESAKYYPLGEGIWVNIINEMKQNHNELNRNYVEITGTFNAMSHGHMGLFIGTLENIEKVSLVSPRHDYR